MRKLFCVVATLASSESSPNPNSPVRRRRFAWHRRQSGDGAVEWNDESVKAIADAGYNAVQLNIAWGGRPHGEPLNLRDIVGIPGEPLDEKVKARQPQFHKRIELAKNMG